MQMIGVSQEHTVMGTAKPWEDLRKKFVEALKRSAPFSWFEIWQLFWEDQWYQAELTKQARFVLRAGSAPEEWLEDVRHEAMLILASKLHKVPSLGLDRKGLGEKFPPSIKAIARNECRQALKRLRRIYRTGAELSSESDFRAAIGIFQLQERSLDLSAAIDELPEPLCSVLRLYQLGHDIRAIAQRLSLTYWAAYRAFRRGVERLHTDLGLP